jgi:hypothetical protein
MFGVGEGVRGSYHGRTRIKQTEKEKMQSHQSSEFDRSLINFRRFRNLELHQNGRGSL